MTDAHGSGSTTGPASPSTARVWKDIDKASFAVLSFVTSTGRPRASGIMYTAASRRLYVVTAAKSLKARQISDGDEVAVTIPIRRGGLLSLIAPIPPATVSFHATATVHPAGSFRIESVNEKFAAMLPKERRSGCVIELAPTGDFLTYGIGVSLREMSKPESAMAHVPVA